MSGQGAQRSSHGPVPTFPQRDHMTLLKQLLDRSRASEEATALIARQLSELNQTVGSIIERSAAPAADMGPPPSATPRPKPQSAKRIGGPGTFRPPVRVPVPKPASTNELHVSCSFLCFGGLRVNRTRINIVPLLKTCFSEIGVVNGQHHRPRMS
jgi:hypothetical protein